MPHSESFLFIFRDAAHRSHSLWVEKLVLLDFYRRLLHNVRWEKLILRVFYIAFALTYIPIPIVTMVECQPLYLYWQVIPNPGVNVSMST